MYGLLLQNMQEYVIQTYGKNTWDEIRKALKIKQEIFSAEETFPESQIIKMGKKAIQLAGVPEEEFYEGMGIYFVELTNRLGYSNFLNHLGRHLRDFLLNLDNFHDYLKFTFPRMRAPSFFIEQETDTSLKLQYRSKRRGFHFYVQGQIKEVARTVFNSHVEIKFLKQEVVFDTVICQFHLKFDNSGYTNITRIMQERKEASLPIKASVIFEMFPFCILFRKDLTVSAMGIALQQVIPKMTNKKITVFFELIKPLIEFKYEEVLQRNNSMFELATAEEIDKLQKSRKTSTEDIGKFSDVISLGEEVDKTLHIKGQMIFVPEWNQILFLACPMMTDLNHLIWTGLFVNDLSMHDYSRDIMLATAQEHIELRMSLGAAEAKAKALDSQLRRLDEVQRRTDELLYQMIPKAVATKLREGSDMMELCELFESVTLLFSDIVGFTTICSRLKPVQVVIFLNNLYTLFDFLVDQNAVYKVETIGDAYLIVAGCPTKTKTHPQNICDMALDMMDGLRIMKDPGTGNDITMRIGCHSGPVVAGVVGIKMPRYCLFGLNVGLTEKFESNSQPMKIHISQPCKELLPTQYRTEERNGEPELRDKIGGYASHFLLSKDGRKPLSLDILKALLPTESEAPRLADEEGQEHKAMEEAMDNDNVDPPAVNQTAVRDDSTPTLVDDASPAKSEGDDGWHEKGTLDDGDAGSLYNPELERALRLRREEQLDTCGGFEKSHLCLIL